MTAEVRHLADATYAGDVVKAVQAAVRKGAREVYAVAIDQEGSVECWYTVPENLFAAIGALRLLSRRLESMLDESDEDEAS